MREGVFYVNWWSKKIIEIMMTIDGAEALRNSARPYLNKELLMSDKRILIFKDIRLTLRYEDEEMEWIYPHEDIENNPEVGIESYCEVYGGVKFEVNLEAKFIQKGSNPEIVTYTSLEPVMRVLS